MGAVPRLAQRPERVSPIMAMLSQIFGKEFMQVKRATLTWKGDGVETNERAEKHETTCGENRSCAPSILELPMNHDE